MNQIDLTGRTDVDVIPTLGPDGPGRQRQHERDDPRAAPGRLLAHVDRRRGRAGHRVVQRRGAGGRSTGDVPAR